MPEVPGCPQIMVDDAIREACRQFSFDTWAITYDVTLFNTVATTQSYILTPPVQHEIFGIQTVVKDGTYPPLDPVAEQTVARYVQTNGGPTSYWFKSTKIWLYPTPDKVVSLAVEALIRPLQSATTVDDQFLEFRDAIAGFAKGRLMLVSGKSWYNPTDAQTSFRTYMKHVGDQRIRLNSGRVAAPLRAMAAFF